jgi:hypothetical protein
MRNIVIGLIILMLVGVSGAKTRGAGDPCYGPAGSMLAGPLRGMHLIDIRVTVEGETRQGSAASLEQVTSQEYKDQILVILRSKAPALRYIKLGTSDIDLNILLAGNGPVYGGTVTLEIMRYVDIKVGYFDTTVQSPFSGVPTGRINTHASVWSDAVAIIGPHGGANNQIRSEVDRLMDSFLAAYFRDNP